MFTIHDLSRLESSRNLWLATVRPNGAPHLVPIWFVWLAGYAYLCTGRRSVKARNLESNPNFSFALEDGDDPIVIEGTAQILENTPVEVVEAFQKKFNWNIEGDSQYNAIIRLTPTRVLL
jgi:nitroimidazol reductase NimA-like FMN-containing flavoprotein (pyridoxamine 5'-phosphate oxidase superfamily)